MTIIGEQDVIESIENALQFISYYHPPDFISAMHKAFKKEANPVARNAIAQILINSKMSATGHRPICQDTGIVNIFIKIGMSVQWQHSMSIEDMCNEGIRRAYTHPDNVLRASILKDPDGLRINTGDNTPGVIYYDLQPGNNVEIHLAAKGGGSEAKAKFVVLNPADSVVDWILTMLPQMGAGWCPPGILGIGIGGTAEKAMLLAKQSLLEPININELQAKGAQNRVEELRLELFDKVNKLGIGAQGLGGLTTVLDVKVKDYPTHAANKAVAIVPNCAATRHIHFKLDGSGPAIFTPPKLTDWPEIAKQSDNNEISIDLQNVNHRTIRSWRIGDRLLLNGKILTGRDAAHKKMVELLNQNLPLPVNLQGKFIYYVGPVDPVRHEVLGPAGPTTATRMDKFTEQILAHTGLIGMIGKAERGQLGIDAIKKFKATYLIAVGGAAYLVSQAIKKAKIVAFPELGMEAIYELEVEDMPVIVAVDTQGRSIHTEGPKLWATKIATQKLNIQ